MDCAAFRWKPCVATRLIASTARTRTTGHAAASGRRETPLLVDQD